MPTYYYEQYDLYFVRVPKTASASIMSVLGKPTKSYWDFPEEAKVSDILPIGFGSKRPKVLALIRHPIERFRSAYGMWLGRGGVRSIEQALGWALVDPPVDPTLKVGVHFTSMTHAHFGLEHTPHIYRYEDLHNVWGKICEYVGLPAGTQLPRLRETYTKPELTSMEEGLVRAIYQRDFQILGYD